VQQKTFYKLLLDVNLNPSKVKQSLLDKRLTRIEKTIIESYLLIRNNQNNEALNILKGLPPSEFAFVEAQKNLLIGISLNNQSMFTEAEIAIWKSIPTLKTLESQYFLFAAYFNLCFIYFNNRHLSKMNNIIQAMEGIKQESDIQETRLLRCKFIYYSEINETIQAKALLKQIETRKSTMPESDAISHLLLEFSFFVKMEDFVMCEHLLLEMKNFRKYNLTENYNFLKKMLHHLTAGGPIYAYQSDFQYTPILHHQIKVIQSLEEKNLDLAKSHWDALASSNANIYQEHFHYAGGKCLFSLCLAKHTQSIAVPKNLEIKGGVPKVDALISLLTEAGAPLPGPMIYEILWGETPVEKQDMNKLKRLIYRAKNEKQIEIKFHKGTYAIGVDKKSNRKAS